MSILPAELASQRVSQAVTLPILIWGILLSELGWNIEQCYGFHWFSVSETKMTMYYFKLRNYYLISNPFEFVNR
jgi:hypothetical protein